MKNTSMNELNLILIFKIKDIDRKNRFKDFSFLKVTILVSFLFFYFTHNSYYCKKNYKNQLANFIDLAF
jgi:hypothetical protein